MKYMAGRALSMQALALDGINTMADWEAVREDRRREFRANLSLTRVPEFESLRQRTMGEFTGEGYRMRRIGFEVLPNCWSSANIYYPDPMPASPAPGVLYVSGHARIGVQNYQYNAQMWARRSYVCMILDSIEQSDNPGEHHGFAVGREDLWISLGYTSAGGEVLNSLRALDLLEADPAVDPARLGVTGISGGGAQSFYVAAIDERVKAVSTIGGISAPFDAIGGRRLFAHCDCMYPQNLFGRDISDYAALIAPRATLFCFGDNDPLFHPQETSGLVERARKVFDLYGAGDKCRLLTASCGHENHPVFYEATQEWFDRHVAGDVRPFIEKNQAPELNESQTTVFNGAPPHPNYLQLLPSLMCPRGTLTLPQGMADWSAVREQAVEALPQPRAQAVEPTPVFVSAGEWGRRAQHRGELESMELWIETYLPSVDPKRFLLTVANAGEYAQHARAHIGRIMLHDAALFVLEPRIAGGDLPPRSLLESGPLGSKMNNIRSRMMQAMALTGQTPVTMTVHDIGAALDYLVKIEAFGKMERYLHGRGENAVAALHYAVRHPEIAGLILEDLPSTHADGAPVPGILNVCDIPEMLGLLAPRKVAVVNPGHGNWNWSTRAFERLGVSNNLLFCEEIHTAITHLF